MKPQELKELRKSKGLSQVNFAKLTGISPALVSKMERGLTPVSSKTSTELEKVGLLPPEKPKLQIEEGKRYVRRDGEITDPIIRRGDGYYALYDPLYNQWYMDDGCFYYTRDDTEPVKHPYDLIREYVEEEPKVDDTSNPIESRLTHSAEARLTYAALKTARQAELNVIKHGIQDVATLIIAMTEELGEIARAHQDTEGNERIEAEAIDLGALCLQLQDLVS